MSEIHSAKFDENEPRFTSDIHSAPVRQNFQALQIANHLRGRALDPAEAKVYIEPGKFKFSGVQVYSWPGGVFPASGAYEFPTDDGTSRVDLIYFELVNGDVNLSKTKGDPGTNPSPPGINPEWVPVCFVHVTSGDQAITADMISDARSINNAGIVQEDSIEKKQLSENSVGIDELDPDDISWLNQDGTLNV